MTARTSGNLADLVRDAAAASPDKPALVFHGDVDDLAASSTRRCPRPPEGLLGLGLERGDRVALHLGNSPEFVAVYFGALRAGLVVLPVNTAYTGNELGHVITDSGAAAVVTTQSTAETVSVGDLGACRGGRHSVVRGLDGSSANPWTAGDLARTWLSCSTRPARAGGPRARCSATARCSPTSSRAARSSRPR